MERLRTSVDLLFALDQLDHMTGLGQKEEIEYRLFSSDYALIERYHRIFSGVHHILIGSEKVGDRAELIAAYRPFIEMIKARLVRPLDLSWDEVATQTALSDRWVDVIERYGHLHTGMERVIEAVLADWPPELVGGDEDRLRDLIIGHFEEIEKELADRLDLDLETIEVLVGDCKVVRDDLWQLFHEVGGAGTGPDGSDGAALSEEDAALNFFDFPAGSRPSMEEVKKAYRKFALAHHPDHAEDQDDTDEKARRNELLKQANLLYDVLRRHFEGLYTAG